MGGSLVPYWISLATQSPDSTLLDVDAEGDWGKLSEVRTLLRLSISPTGGDMPIAHAGPKATSQIVRFDCYEADLDSGQLHKRGIRIKLREQSFQVLAALLERPGQVVTRDDLRRQLWADDVFVDFENNLNAVIARLREALSDSAEHPRFIETLPKRGYRFIGEISSLVPAAGKASVRRSRLLVLPFLNLSGDAAEEYFSDAMTDEIITALAGVAPEYLAVIARTTAMRYKGKINDVTRIGRELDVDYVVEGSVRRTADRVGINVQLIQTSDQTHLFAKKYDTTLDDVFSVQNAIAEAVSASIPRVASRISNSRAFGLIRRKPTEDPVAYNLYLKGHYHLRHMTPDGIAKGKQYFEQAIARDPQFALAYHGLADVYWTLGFLGLTRPKEAFSAGVFAALRAVEIDNSLAQAHALLGSYRKELDYNWPEVHREMVLATQLDPASSDVLHCYAGSDLMAQGHIQESIAVEGQAVEIDPLSGFIRAWFGFVLFLGRQYERALQQISLAIELDPSYFFSHLATGMVRCEQGMFGEAVAALGKAAQLSGGAPLVLGWQGMTYARCGDTTGAQKVLADLYAMATQAYVLPTSFAWINLGLGQIDEAYKWMERAIDDRDPIIVPIKSYPFLDPLRDDGRFHELLRKMNLET